MYDNETLYLAVDGKVVQYTRHTVDGNYNPQWAISAYDPQKLSGLDTSPGLLWKFMSNGVVDAVNLSSSKMCARQPQLVKRGLISACVNGLDSETYVLRARRWKWNPPFESPRSVLELADPLGSVIPHGFTNCG